jgi:hypothetical protein
VGLVFCVAQQPNSGLDRLTVVVSRLRTINTYARTHARLESSERAISLSRRPLSTQHTNKRDEHPSQQWDSNPRSQQSCGFRPHSHRDRLLNDANKVTRISYQTAKANCSAHFIVPHGTVATVVFLVTGGCKFAKCLCVGTRQRTPTVLAISRIATDWSEKLELKSCVGSEFLYFLSCSFKLRYWWNNERVPFAVG